jgi:hypothetical protein
MLLPKLVYTIMISFQPEVLLFLQVILVPYPMLYGEFAVTILKDLAQPSGLLQAA